MVWLFGVWLGWGLKVRKLQKLKMVFRHWKNFFLRLFQFFYIIIVKCLICYVTIQNFRLKGLFVWFLYNFKQKFSKNRTLDPFKSPWGYFWALIFWLSHIITQGLSKKKKLKFSPSVFSLLTAHLKTRFILSATFLSSQD